MNRFVALYIIYFFCLLPLKFVQGGVSPKLYKNSKQKRAIHELSLKTGFLDNTNLNLVALDSFGKAVTWPNGSYPVEINGFEQSLFFLLGRAHFPGTLKNSTFLVLKPVSEKPTIPSFFILVRWGLGIYPQKISVYWLLGIPLVVVILCFFFRRLIILIGVLLLLFFLFHKGVNPIHFLKGIWDWIFYHFRTILGGS